MDEKIKEIEEWIYLISKDWYGATNLDELKKHLVSKEIYRQSEVTASGSKNAEGSAS
ncbi:hypothetical protein [Ralstonia solanacearum]|uniref:Uncharacterized protein n=1 Tax=Ralstonia solanacearum TaxID=305 RepID=A0AAE3NMM0_RALSL|nr:hypothetical protein [Ralstonia solanacearum]MBB6581564.1 hypothetical protein [Ralstonia solanacearum]MDB0524690.1 hypothetical protein [Ralstonia solanacearum]